MILKGWGGGRGRIFGGHPFELFKTPRVVLTWIVARKVGRCDVGDCFGFDANDLNNRKSDFDFSLRVKTIFKPFAGPIPEPL